jgi:hypothetical protein
LLTVAEWYAIMPDFDIQLTYACVMQTATVAPLFYWCIWFVMAIPII